MDAVADTARILLEGGAETCRVEDTAFRISRSIQEINKTNVLVSYTCIVIYLSSDSGDLVTIRKTIPRATNLWKACQISNFSGNLANDVCTLDGSIEIINRIDKRSVGKELYISGAIVVPGLFTHLPVRGIIEPIVAFFISILGVPVFRLFQQKENPQLVNIYTTIAFMTLLIMLVLRIFGVLNAVLDMNSVTVGCAVPFVPGVFITNSVRDVLSGDLLSGISSVINTIITALSVALGVGSALYLAVMTEVI